MYSNWRDCQAWREQNLPMNTTSNEACKLYDVCLSQVVGWYENKQYGGLLSSLDAMIQADPNFIVGNCLKYGVELLGTNALLNSSRFNSSINDLVQTAKALANTLTERELLHVKAIQALKNGQLPTACDTWEQILVDHPNDILALKFAHSGYFYLGYKPQMRDSLARVIPLWNPNLPHYNYLFGMYAFGLTQTNSLDKAEQTALKGIEMNRNDAWAIHALSHVNEYKGNYKQGIDFLLKTESDWKICDLISCHNYWHLALFYIDNKDYESVIELIDNHMLKTGSTLDLVNSSSLLIRLQLLGARNEAFSERWSKIKAAYLDRIEQHGFLYSDSHIAMVLGSCGTIEEKTKYINSLLDYINSPETESSCVKDEQFDKLTECELAKKKNDTVSNYLKSVNRDVGIKLINGIFAYSDREFDKAVEFMYPLKYELIKIGGSNAQLDIFNQILIDAAFNSKKYKKNAYALINERSALRPNSNFTERMLSKLVEVDQF